MHDLYVSPMHRVCLIQVNHDRDVVKHVGHHFVRDKSCHIHNPHVSMIHRVYWMFDACKS